MKGKTPSKRGEIDALPQAALVNSGNGHKKSVVIIPTYNEVGNLQRLVPSILRQGQFDILIVDDNSPDGTGALAEELARRYVGRVSVLHRPDKLGLGSAYLAGFRYVLALGYQQVYTMDADFSHDPSALPVLRKALEEADVVLGSRYVAGGGTLRWPLWRRLLSRGGSAYASVVLGLPLRDLTGGFKGFRREVLETLLPDMETIQAQGYAFQIEMTYRCARQGFRIVEVPIRFEERLVGKSKLSRGIVTEALRVVWKLRLSQGSARPRSAARPRTPHGSRRVLAVALAVVLALVSLTLVVGAASLAPRWFAALAHGRVVQPASLSQMHPPPPVQRRSIPALPAARAQTAALQLQGADLTSNVPLRFVGAGFLPGEAVVVTIQDQAGQPEAQLALLIADHAGEIGATVEAIPADLPPGIHTLLVEGQSSHRRAQAAFQVHRVPPTVQLDAYSAQPGHAIGFAGSGFMSKEVVEVRLGATDQVVAQVVAAATTNVGGNVAGRFTIPLLPEGTYTLFFTGLKSQTPVSVRFKVLGFHPWVVLDTYAPSPHTRLGFVGHDFVPNEEVLVYLNQRQGRTPVVRLQADASGRFAAPAAWEVGGLSGANTLIFVGQEGGAVVTIGFIVVP